MTENEVLNNVNGYPLDERQKAVVKNSSKHLLVSAGAGSGKTLTIIGKIRYLIEIKKLKQEEIICISFTNEATNNLKNKLKENYNYDIPCYTFHKLGFEIIKENHFKISNQNLLSYTIEEYLLGLINIDKENKKRVLSFLKIKFTNKNYEKKYKNIIEKELPRLKSLIEKFINLLKSNDLEKDDITNFIKKEKKTKNKNILIVIFYIYQTYQKELTSKKEIDFNDMISLATQKVKTNGYKNKIKYIIIDEFQDTSLVRFNLIKAILDSTKANLLVVGDDFQSIYRFTGCDLTLFINFKSFFKKSQILKIENTYRNSQELITIAGSFIMENKNQIKKDLKSKKHLKYPIEIVYYKNMIITLIKLLKHIHNKTNKPILILGRNNFDINKIIEDKRFTLKDKRIILKENEDIKISYLTVHRSKGLEEENVIVINLENKKTGFPNQINDHPILNYVTCKKDDFPYAEERRLFYVAITRTKNKTYLLTPRKNESVFIKELIKNNKNKIKIVKSKN